MIEVQTQSQRGQQTGPVPTVPGGGGGNRQAADDQLRAIDDVLDNALSADSQTFNQNVAQTIGQ
jgi:hypothetical protein